MRGRARYVQAGAGGGGGAGTRGIPGRREGREEGRGRGGQGPAGVVSRSRTWGLKWHAGAEAPICIQGRVSLSTALSPPRGRPAACCVPAPPLLDQATCRSIAAAP